MLIHLFIFYYYFCLLFYVILNIYLLYLINYIIIIIIYMLTKYGDTWRGPKLSITALTPIQYIYPTQLVTGCAEIFGSEIAVDKVYKFPSLSNSAVFTWQGCSISISFPYNISITSLYHLYCYDYTSISNASTMISIIPPVYCIERKCFILAWRNL